MLVQTVFLCYLYDNVTYVMLWFLYTMWWEAMFLWDLLWCPDFWVVFETILGVILQNDRIFPTKGSESASLNNLKDTIFVTVFDCSNIYVYKNHKP